MIGRMSVPDLTPLAAAVLAVRPEPERVLEIGCGDGEATLFLAREFLHARVRGVDPSAEAVRAASARIGLDPEGRVAFKRGSARRLPYPDGNFDLVVQRSGRLHPGEIARVLRPRGWLITATRPRFGGLERRGFVAAAADGELFLMRLEDEARAAPRA
jgi:ubiquinone/menaquinone biosynthesis C-methylase UbiE